MFIRFLACSKKDLSLVWKQVCKRVTTNVVVRNASGNSSEKDLAKVSDFVDGSEAARQDFRHLAVLPDFISEEEEAAILQEVDNSFRRSKYQYSHWDEAIVGFRETEKGRWKNSLSLSTIKNLQDKAVNAVSGKVLEPLPLIHVLDLAEDGYIKPHVDSAKFCGEVIAGISLLSPSVMRFQHETDSAKFLLALLPPRSLYILKGILRSDYTHEIFGNTHSYFRGDHIPRSRRVSVICRTRP